MNSNAEYEKMCVYCEHATPIFDSAHVLCSKNGIVLCTHACKKFIYDPMKRTVRKKPVIEKFSDFSEND